VSVFEAAMPTHRFRSASRRRGSRSAVLDRSLPTGRAVLGGALVACAVLGVYVAGTHRRDPRIDVLVANRDLPAGSVIATEDLALARVDLPEAQARAVALDPEQLVGKSLTRPLDSGELFGLSAVATDVAVTRQAVSIKVPPERALAGSLRHGDHVAVYATVGDCTRLIAATALVSEASDAGTDLSGGDVMVTLEVDTAAEVLSVVHASRTGEVTLAVAGVGPASLCSPGTSAGG
jgi:Flp pilus assembly protein CpaB